MTKTKGNVVEFRRPVNDETRAASASRSSTGRPRDRTSGSDVKLENARNFANKLWNATRYVVRRRSPRAASASSPTDATSGRPSAGCGPGAAATVEAVDGAIAQDAFGDATRRLYEAIWSEFCDWGLELAKVRLTDRGSARGCPRGDVVDPGRGGARRYLRRLLHPVMPFVTEAIWSATRHRAEPQFLSS